MSDAAGQPWYLGAGIPLLSPVGYFRFEDPAGEVGMETHLGNRRQPSSFADVTGSRPRLEPR